MDESESLLEGALKDIRKLGAEGCWVACATHATGEESLVYKISLGGGVSVEVEEQTKYGPEGPEKGQQASYAMRVLKDGKEVASRGGDAAKSMYDTLEIQFKQAIRKGRQVFRKEDGKIC